MGPLVPLVVVLAPRKRRHLRRTSRDCSPEISWWQPWVVMLPPREMKAMEMSVPSYWGAPQHRAKQTTNEAGMQLQAGIAAVGEAWLDKLLFRQRKCLATTSFQRFAKQAF